MLNKRPLKGHLPPREVFALGSKAKSGLDTEAKPISSSSAGHQLRKPVPALGSTSSVGFKREAGPVPLGVGPLVKKPRPVAQTFTPLGRPSETDYRGSPTTQVYLYEEIATEVEPHEFSEAVEDVAEKGDDERLEALLCGAVKALKMSRAKPDQALYVSLFYLVKTRPMLFQSEVVVEAFASLLKRDVAINFKAKGNPLVSVLACNVLATAFQDEENWPDSFVKVYLDDSLGERIWVDRPDCRLFVENVMTAFNSKLPTISMMATDATVTKGESVAAGSSPPHATLFGEEDDTMTYADRVIKSAIVSTISEYEIPPALIAPRYNCQYMSIETYVLDVIRDQLSRRQPMDGGSRNLVRTMMVVCGYSDIRMLAAHRLEMWLQNPKLTRAAQDLLMSICMNCDQQNSPQDVEVTSLLSKIRLKTKSLVNHYLLCIRELLGQNSENLCTLLPQTIYNELQLQSTTRNPNNMLLISAMFHQAPEQSTKLLAEICAEILMLREDHLKLLRTLLREIYRNVKQDLNLSAFSLGLMCERSDAKFRDLDPFLKERYFVAITDLLCLTMLLGVSANVREQASAAARVDVKDPEVLRNIQKQVANIQRDTVWWLHSVVPKMISIKPSECLHGLRKLLFVEKAEHYCKTDNWPPENERSALLRLVSDVPILEDTLIRILLMGLNRDFHLSAPDVIELTDILVRRAAHLYAEDFPVLKVDRLELIDALLNLCTYRHPENIILPKGYQPPSLAITTLYWKAWTILLVLAAFNPGSFEPGLPADNVDRVSGTGCIDDKERQQLNEAFAARGYAHRLIHPRIMAECNISGLCRKTTCVKAWENYPTLKCIMEMTMTSNFKFPPPTIATDDKTAEEIRNRERQMAEFVKQQILEFEGHLAAATSKQPITESNSLLITQLTRLEPEGLALRPPPGVLDHIKSLNQSLRIGHMLCRSRSPDFLLDIIQRQGTSQSMPWLAELVESNDSSLDVLPVQCLCEFLLHDSSSETSSRDEDEGADKQKKQQKQQKQEQLLSRLHNLLHSSVSDPHAISEVLAYFLKRLNSQQTAARKQAIKGLSMVLLKPSTAEESASASNSKGIIPALACHRWLLEQLPSLPQFDAIKIQACLALRHACQVETDAVSVSAYIIFLSEHTATLDLQDLHGLALDMAQLIVERATLINHLLPQEDIMSECADVVLSAMIGLFYNYLMKAQQPQHEGYSWSNTQDQILLQWGSGKSATMNILVVHAMIILLTYGKPSGPSKFNDLLDSWFPENGSPPSAFLVDTSEEALLLPDWLKLRMIRSNNPRLVDAALTDLEPSQLLLFVQSFGIPVVSMSKLLRCLDQAVDIDSSEMEQAIVDKGYMAQLIEVQRMRGATGGDKFHRLLLNGNGELPAPVTEIEPSVKVQKISDVPPVQKLDVTSSSRWDDIGHISDVLAKMFDVVSSPISTVEQQDLYRRLLKAVQNLPTCDLVVNACINIIKSSKGKLFIEGLLRHTFLAAGFLRTLMAIAKETFRELAQLLSTELPSGGSVLRHLVNGYLSKAAEPASVASGAQSLSTQLIKPGMSGHKALRTVLDHVGADKMADGEQMLNACLKDILKTGKDQDDVTDDMCQAICADTSNNDRPNSLLRGLMVDWFEVLNPDVVRNHLETQLEFIFSKRQRLQNALMSSESSVVASSSSSSSSSSSPLLLSSDCRQTYMLALVINRSSWSDMRLIVRHLLSSQAIVKRYYASAVLDFLWACIHIPRLWQGRDKKLSKNHIPEDVLGLSLQQVVVLVDYIISEAESQMTMVAEVSQLSDDFEKRMELLHRCCCRKHHLLKAVIAYLTKSIESGRDGFGVCRHLLMDIYLWVPQLVMRVESMASLIRNSPTAIKHTSRLDIISHHLVNFLASAAPGKAAENRMLNSNIACRKLASDHPVIILRQLPMISALLQGRAQYNFGEVKSRNYLLLYTHLLGILELLQPFVFEPAHRMAFQNLMQAYFELIMIHGLRNKSLGAIIQKFLQFLQNYINFDRTQATSVLQKYIPILNELSNCYSEMPILGSLIAGLTLPTQEHMEEAAKKTDDVPSSADRSVVALRSGSPFTLNHLGSLLQRTKKDTNSSELVDALKELDEMSKRHVEVLEHFVVDLRRLMLDSNDICRNSSFGFMMRLVRHDPNIAKEFKQTMLKSLLSKNPDVVNSALKNLSEYVMLAQEHGPELLQTAFQAGITTNADVGSCISETLQLLNVDMMT